MKIVCDNCSTKYSIADEKVRGKVFKIKCKKCSHIIVVKGTEGTDAFDGIGCAIAGTSAEALRIAEELALAVGGRPFEVRDEQRAGYHAAASIASNYLVTLQAAAEAVAAASGLPEGFRSHLVPLVRGTVENWAAHGPREALTGPIVRGDEPTVQRQRAAVEASAPDLLPLFDELTERTRALIGAEGAPV